MLNQFIAAAQAARNTHALDETARLTWRAHGEGCLSDADAQAVSEAVEARRASFATRRSATPSKAAHGLPRAARRPPRSPDRQASLERRRRQAASGVVPARSAASFTMGEIATLTIVAREIQRRQVCVLPVDAIAALAGVSRTTVQNALREARRLGLILVRERRIPGQKSLTNVIRIVSREWLAWIGFKKLSPTNNNCSSKGLEAVCIDPQWCGHERRSSSPHRRSAQLEGLARRDR